jgi:hypothetical protein
MSKRKWKLATVAAVMLAALAWWAIQVQSASSHVWIEFHARPASICYQGPPRRAVASVQLWPGGPGVTLMRQYHRNLNLMQDRTVEPPTDPTP